MHRPALVATLLIAGVTSLVVAQECPVVGGTATIAQNSEILNLDEAAAHPAFAYRPETGEERFHSFAGVPVIRRERAVGREYRKLIAEWSSVLPMQSQSMVLPVRAP